MKFLCSETNRLFLYATIILQNKPNSKCFRTFPAIFPIFTKNNLLISTCLTALSAAETGKLISGVKQFFQHGGIVGICARSEQLCHLAYSIIQRRKREVSENPF